MSTSQLPRSEGGEVTPATESRDLGRLVRSGVGWMMISQVSLQILGFATAVVVAHFLTPREVGLFAEALVFSKLSLVITDAGVAAAVVQKLDLTEDDKSTAFWVGVAIGVVMMLAGFGLSWPISSLYGEPRVQTLFVLLSPAFLFTSLGVVQGALLTRELKFRSLEIRTVAATAVSASAAMLLAVLGLGATTLAIQVLTVSGVSTILLWRTSSWRPSRRFSFSSVRQMAGFSSHVLGGRMVQCGSMNVDNLLIGRFVGAARLGVYSIAFNLMITPVIRLAGPVTQVFFPAFSRIRDPARIAEVWLRAVRLIAAAVVPAMLGLVIVAPDFIEVVFGRRWHEAAPVLQILAPIGMVQAVQALNFGILQSLARTRVLFRYTLFASVGAIGAFIAGLPWGVEGVATAYALTSLVVEPIYLIVVTRVLGVPIRMWANSVRGVVEASAVMVGIIAAARVGLVHLGEPPSARLAILIVIGFAAYVPLLRWREPRVIDEISELRRRRSQPA